MPVMPHGQPTGTGMQRHEIKPQPSVPMPFAQPVRAPGAQQVHALAPSHALLRPAAAAVGAVADLDHHHPAGILRYEVDLTGTFTHVASKNAESSQAKKGGREILRGPPAHLTRNDPAHRRRAARTLGRMDAAAEQAGPALRDAIKDPDPSVRSTAAEALEKIHPK